MRVQQVRATQIQLDDLHNSTFAGVKFTAESGKGPSDEAADRHSFEAMSERQFSQLGREDPAARKSLIAGVKSIGQLAQYEAAVVPLRMRRKRRQVCVLRLSCTPLDRHHCAAIM